MSRSVRIILMGCAVAMLFAAVGASSAYALFSEGVKCEAPGKEGICITTSAGGVLNEAIGEENALLRLDTGTVAKLLVPSLTLELESTEAECLGCIVHQASPLTVLGTITGQVVFKKVHIIGTLAPKCKVINETVTTKKLVAEGLNETEVEVKPETGKVFAEIEIGNNGAEICPATVKGINPVKGKIACEVLEPKVNAVVKLCEFEGHAGLEFGTSAATLDSEAELELEDKWFWDYVVQ